MRGKSFAKKLDVVVDDDNEQAISGTDAYSPYRPVFEDDCFP